MRPAPEHVALNGKKFHIHTFGCQVRLSAALIEFCALGCIYHMFQRPIFMSVSPTQQMNSADSERMAGALELAGYVCTPEAQDADVLVYNTCSIREKAENKV